MNSAITSLLIISFLAVAVFGFIAIGHDGCIAALVAGGVCPTEGDMLALTASHFQIFKSFSTAIFSLLLALSLAIWLLLRLLPTRLPIIVLPQRLYFNASIHFDRLLLVPLQQRLRQWLTLVAQPQGARLA
jgi:hypothetical protein